MLKRWDRFARFIDNGRVRLMKLAAGSETRCRSGGPNDHTDYDGQAQ